MHQVRRPDTAFSVVRQKKPRKESRDHLAFIRELPCAVCLTRKWVEAAHLRVGNRKLGKPETGMGEKADDRWTLPLCRPHHDEQHKGNELAFWTGYGIDPFTLALSLHGVSGDLEQAEAIIRANAPSKRTTA